MPDTMMFNRVRAEYLEMPGLRLTLQQTQRLCGVERAVCQMVLDALVDARFLCVKADGTYARVSEGSDRSRAHSTQANLRARADSR